MKINVYNQSGEKVKDVELSKVFDVEASDKALTLYINYLRSSLRAPVANTKDRSEVSGGGKKPWKQKGTGRARHGSSRSPLWVGGGVTFGPSSDQNFKLRINKNMKKNIILSSFNKMFKANNAIVIDTLAMDEPKTKKSVQILENIKAAGKISVLLSDEDTNAKLGFRNIAGVHTMTPNKLDLVNLITSKNLVLSLNSLNKIEEIYNSNK